jgi:RNA polymerase sigma-70 factor (ECF subfamily)
MAGDEAMADLSREATRAAFVARVDAHGGVVQAVARAYCWTPADRDDLVQDILAQAWRAFGSYDADRPFATWLYRVALNVAISWLRRHAPRQRATVPLDVDVHDAAGAPLDPVAAERVRALTAAIHELPPLDRALVLLYLDDRTHRDIAAVLGISESNVATRLHRLKQRLRRSLESRP